jgi:ADP-glucose pyrophosphorylase
VSASKHRLIAMDDTEVTERAVTYVATIIDGQLQGGYIRRSILAPGVHIDAAAEVVESILFDGVRIGQGARVHRAVIDRDMVVPPGARIGEVPASDATHVTVSAGGITVMGYPPPHRTSKEVWS